VLFKALIKTKIILKIALPLTEKTGVKQERLCTADFENVGDCFFAGPSI